MRKYRKHKCCQCGKIATWYNYDSHKDDLEYFCDDCVPRGCIENVKNTDKDGEPMLGAKVMWWDCDADESDFLHDGDLEPNTQSFYYEVLDNNGRRKPSHFAYCYEENGFELIDNSYYLRYYDVRQVFGKTCERLNYLLKLDVESEISYIFEKNHTLYDEFIIDYNIFMQKLSKFVYNVVDRDIKQSLLSWIKTEYEDLRKFYEYFKTEIKKVKLSLKSLLRD